MSMEMPGIIVGLFLGAYLLGSIPFGLILGRAKGIDIRRTGSGNIGAANVGRTLGARWGVAVFLLDMAKGALAAIGSGMVLEAPAESQPLRDQALLYVWLAVGLCAILGHNYSVFLAFRGGKGVATSFGVALGIYPDLAYPAVLCFVIWAILVAVTRMSSVGSLGASLLFPIAYLGIAWREGGPAAIRAPILLFCVLLTALLIWRHRSNMARILHGSEARLGR